MNRILTLTSSAATASDAAAQSGGMSWIVMLGIYVVFFVALYFIFFRPQNKRKKKEEAMRKNAEIGDMITTIGGICGRIVGVKDENTIVIETGADRSKLQIKRWAIGSVDTVHEDTE